MAASPHLGREHRSGICPKRARIVARSTAPPEGATILCLDELGPVSPRTFPPAPGWSPDGHRIKAPLDSSRGPDKVWVYGALRPGDGQALTQTALARNTAGFKALLDAVEQANPDGDLYLIADNLSSHKSAPIQAWLMEHPRVHIEPLPTGACWLNLIEGWWRLFRRAAFAGQSFADHTELETATHLATCQLNRHAKPWVWGRPPRRHRQLRRCFVYRL
ncbi:transposase [Nitrolancea hollandica Lb]|uniref:Transposase n=1 Tax=Nitrolancea hollandica Lb TaxID=1129897 RepID=I4EKZ2_9BACT|nr:transposase [Nitrolancea hollandica Lb]